ncbi:MAG TPA: hypothetical protein VLW75_10130 [Rhizomicrobium sp.]|nr:hypothetical protein [Rhizomicrobium sp.]
METDPSMTARAREAALAQATRVLMARLAASEDAVAVALEIARGENHVPEARAAALRSIARLMDSAATIATALARMNGTAHDQRVTIERIGGDNPGVLGREESAERRQKLKRYPRGEGASEKFSAHDAGEPSPHLRSAREW